MTEAVGPNILPLFAGYGIELEYMIVDRDQHNVLPVTDEVLKVVAGEYVNDVEQGPIVWSNELVLHVIELKTNGPVSSLEQLPDQFLANIHQINSILDDMNGRLMPTAMHPWMNPWQETRLWPHEASEIYESYNRIFDCQGHGWSNLQSMHINLPFADDREFALLHSAIRALLPLMPALAASSPVMDGEFTGLMDTRLESYRRNAERIPSITGLVIPEAVHCYAEYQQEILHPMYRDIAPHDPGKVLQYEWLNSRGAIARFDRNAIEIRVLDTQETPAADIAITTLIIAVLKALTAGNWSDSATQSTADTTMLAAIFSSCVKHAERAVIEDRHYLALFGFPDRKCEARELWHYLLETVLSVNNDIKPATRSALEFIINKGSLARRICDAIGPEMRRSRLEETYRRLCACLANGELFERID